MDSLEIKYKPQVITLGKLYRLITDYCKQAEITNPDMRPMFTYLHALFKLHQYNLLTKKIENEISVLSKDIEISDWEGQIENEISDEWKKFFWIGYYESGRNRIAAVRKSKGMTQSDLADLIGVSQKDISRWESDKVTLSAITLKKIATALQCTTDELI